ncbi:MAG: acetyl-CoA hydrolase/transferase C-terminal domain-containing protein [Pseudomonadota bacterium]
MATDLSELSTLESTLYDAVDQIIARVGKNLVVGTPLGLGKPNRLINALYRRACEDASIQLEIVTALSLDIPQSKHWLQARLMEPIVERLFGSDYPRLQYLIDLKRHQVPDNVAISEFYFQSGAALGNPTMQRRYISSNYTHVARDMMDRGVNLILQLVSKPQTDGSGKTRYSLSCNPDVTLDLKALLDATPQHKAMAVAQVHPELPLMHGDALIEADFFDLIIEQDPRQPLFAVPRGPVSLRDHAVGFHAAGLIEDGGTLQIGIGSLSDALVHSLILRHQHNDRYRAMADVLDVEPSVPRQFETFEQGLYGASEMFMDGFMHLYRAGILKREVFDELDTMRRANAGKSLPESGTGAIMDGGFFLGSQPFYEFLQGLNKAEQPRFRMHGVGRINQLYGGNEALEIEQRRRARFVNTCMMMTLTGAAVSDGLTDYQMVSGVGGQYNFVAMAHAMDDGRSALMLRSRRESGGKASSNIVWDYPHNTIPRHLRDWVVTEYGVANLRGRNDEECIQAMLMISDAAFQDELIDQAKSTGKLAANWQLPTHARNNTLESLYQRLQPFIVQGDLPEYPFGSDFTAIEQRLIDALQSLKRTAASKRKMLATAWSGQPAQFADELHRVGLDQPKGWKEKLYARLLAGALNQQLLDRSNI